MALNARTTLAIEAFQSSAKADRLAERKRRALHVAVIRVPLEDLDEYVRITTEIENRMEGTL